MTQVILKRRSLLAAITSDAMADNRPLWNRVEQESVMQRSGPTLFLIAPPTSPGKGKSRGPAARLYRTINHRMNL